MRTYAAVEHLRRGTEASLGVRPVFVAKVRAIRAGTDL